MQSTPAPVPASFDRIVFDFRADSLVGQGMGPGSTSFSSSASGHRQLSSWNAELRSVVSPEFPPRYTRASYWYRGYGGGRGALLRRFPETVHTDRRGNTAKALVGTCLTAPRALSVALDAHQEPHTWLNTPETGELSGWGALPRSEYLQMPGTAERLDREASSRPDLAALVAALLRDPGSPMDIPVPADGPLQDEWERLLLLWGAYRTLHGVLGSDSGPSTGRNDWSFSTYEPWPVRGTSNTHRPRIAFRPPAQDRPGAPQPPAPLTPGREDDYHEMALWLVEQLGREGGGGLRGLGHHLPPIAGSPHELVLDHLAERIRTHRAPPPRAAPVAHTRHGGSEDPYRGHRPTGHTGLRHGYGPAERRGGETFRPASPAGGAGRTPRSEEPPFSPGPVSLPRDSSRTGPCPQEPPVAAVPEGASASLFHEDVAGGPAEPAPADDPDLEKVIGQMQGTRDRSELRALAEKVIELCGSGTGDEAPVLRGMSVFLGIPDRLPPVVVAGLLAVALVLLTLVVGTAVGG
ncbi:hypothetical protein ACOALZ_14265 [Nocardiopsis algeriensis]|uniref:hypothetical protein n=1 Tax=Nocardiopsis algeriensis TaxID=1478215 RepID=UPI003B427BC2